MAGLKAVQFDCARRDVPSHLGKMTAERQSSMICDLWSSDCLLRLRCHVTLCDGLVIVVLLNGVRRVRGNDKTYTCPIYCLFLCASLLAMILLE